MINNFYEVDITELPNIDKYYQSDYSIINTRIFITTSLVPTLQLCMIGEQLGTQPTSQFMQTDEFMNGNDIIGGVWFNTNYENIIDSKRIVVLSFNPKSPNFNMDRLAQVVEHLSIDCMFSHSNVVNDFEKLLIASVEYYLTCDVETSDDFIENNFDYVTVIENCEHLTTIVNNRHYMSLYTSLILSLYDKYAMIHIETSQRFDDGSCYAITDDVINEFNIWVANDKQGDLPI